MPTITAESSLVSTPTALEFHGLYLPSPASAYWTGGAVIAIVVILALLAVGGYLVIKHRSGTYADSSARERRAREVRDRQVAKARARRARAARQRDRREDRRPSGGQARSEEQTGRVGRRP